MEHVTLTDIHNSDIWEKIVDKNAPHILLRNFNPQPAIRWHQASILMDEVKFEGIQVRNMYADMYINLSQLEQVLRLNTQFLHIYQFERTIPGTLFLENLSEAMASPILKQNGCRLIINCLYESTTVSSFDPDVIKRIQSIFQVKPAR